MDVLVEGRWPTPYKLYLDRNGAERPHASYIFFLMMSPYCKFNVEMNFSFNLRMSVGVQYWENNKTRMKTQ